MPCNYLTTNQTLMFLLLNCVPFVLINKLTYLIFLSPPGLLVFLTNIAHDFNSTQPLQDTTINVFKISTNSMCHREFIKADKGKRPFHIYGMH